MTCDRKQNLNTS